MKSLCGIFFAVMFLSGCGGGGGTPSDDSVVGNGSSVEDQTTGTQTPGGNGISDSSQSSIGTVLLATGATYTGTGSSPIDRIHIATSNGEQIAITAEFNYQDADRMALWTGSIESPQTRLITGASLPIPSENNQFKKATALRYFDDDTLGLWFTRIGGGTGFMTIDETQALVVAASGVTLQGFKSEREVDTIYRVAHSGNRNLIVGTTGGLGIREGALIWQIEGSITTPIATSYRHGEDSTYNTNGFAYIFDDESCGVTFSNSSDSIVGLTKAGDALFLARISNNLSGCAQSGFAIVKHSDGVYTKLVTSQYRTLELKRAFPDGSFIFEQSGQLFTYTADGSIVDAESTQLDYTDRDFDRIGVSAAMWLDRPSSLSADSEIIDAEVSAYGIDGSVLFEGSFLNSVDALWLYSPNGEIKPVVSKGDVIKLRDGIQRLVRGTGVVIYYEPNQFVIVRLGLDDGLGNPRGPVVLVKIEF